MRIQILKHSFPSSAPGEEHFDLRPACLYAALREKRLSAAASAQLCIQLLHQLPQIAVLFADGVFIAVRVAAGKNSRTTPAGPVYRKICAALIDTRIICDEIEFA